MALAENPDISSRRTSERTDFTNDEIKDGFFKIAFTAEFADRRAGGPCAQIRLEPVRIFVIGNGLPDRLVRRLRPSSTTSAPM